MTSFEGALRDLIAEKKASLQSIHLRLIEEDATKARLSVITGKLRMLSEIEGDIEDLLKKAREPEGSRENPA